METLTAIQADLGARWGAVTDFPRVLEFGDWRAEYRAAKTSGAVFDLTGLGFLRFTGKDCHSLMHRLTMNEMRNLRPGQIVVNALTDAKGKLIEAFYLIERGEWLEIITSRGQAAAVTAWLDRYIFIDDVETEDISSNLVPLLLVGPNTEAILAQKPAPFTFGINAILDTTLEAAAIDGLLPAGILALVPAASASAFYRALLADKKGGEFRPAGATAFHCLRVEQGVPFAGVEITPNANPYEAGLKDYISYTKGCYIGQEVIARLDTYDKIKYEYLGLVIDGEVQPTLPARVWAGEEHVGEITSLVFSPTLGRPCAIARIRRKTAHTTPVFAVESPEGRSLARRFEFLRDKSQQP